MGVRESDLLIGALAGKEQATWSDPRILGLVQALYLWMMRLSAVTYGAELLPAAVEACRAAT